ncbi:MAG: NUDIX hydrolase [Symploca sp. SIO3C6]|uniref:NUDIX hydrolase n=1 Tax=Symploca sp. SIO1C4 TaxID=2607765 RepID=A0A6B3NCW3_9CYAN|nr:NUDIX hydrolase [Symploca sp. SIO3C6]NER28442.1 NUDIX hydrolase [Symploca sp. SIO1C4]NET05929.1 NUDIX hydrolase [Symploca sp. SIO2B6]NET52976.1 NUDIX hydrolase [Merismopedia sp. SIO2A8]
MSGFFNQAYFRQITQYLLGLIFRHPVTGTNIVPILKDGRIVLVRRRDTGLWALPGGMVKWREDIPTTVKRELAEETGLDLVSIQRLVGVYSSPERDSRVHSICVVVAVQAKGNILVQDTLEISEAKAFTLDTLPKQDQLSYDNAQQLQDYLDSTTAVA